MKKGIFWIKNHESRNPEIIAVTVECDVYGNVFDELGNEINTYFNHKEEWKKLNEGSEEKVPFDYYPRGAVEINNETATIHTRLGLNTTPIIDAIREKFGLSIGKLHTIHMDTDNSY